MVMVIGGGGGGGACIIVSTTVRWTSYPQPLPCTYYFCFLNICNSSLLSYVFKDIMHCTGGSLCCPPTPLDINTTITTDATLTLTLTVLLSCIKNLSSVK